MQHNEYYQKLLPFRKSGCRRGLRRPASSVSARRRHGPVRTRLAATLRLRSGDLAPTAAPPPQAPRLDASDSSPTRHAPLRPLVCTRPTSSAPISPPTDPRPAPLGGSGSARRSRSAPPDSSAAGQPHFQTPLEGRSQPRAPAAPFGPRASLAGASGCQGLRPDALRRMAVAPGARLLRASPATGAPGLDALARASPRDRSTRTGTSPPHRIATS